MSLKTKPESRAKVKRPQRRKQPAGAVRRHSKLPLWFGYPVATVILICGILLTALWIWSFVAASWEQDGDLDAAQSAFERQRELAPWVEPWRQDYNIGTVFAGKQMWAEAEKELRSALEKVPMPYQDSEGYIDAASARCAVILNLSEVLNAKAEAAKNSGDSGAAGEIYAEAAELLQPCAKGSKVDPLDDLLNQKPSQGKPDKKSKEAQERHDELKDKAEQNSDKDKSDQKDNKDNKEKKDDDPSKDSDSKNKDQDKNDSKNNGDEKDKTEPSEEPVDKDELERRKKLEEKNQKHSDADKGRRLGSRDGTSDGRNW
ncbi:MAG: hypothetical protein Q4P72_06440 [Eubacteriales bacterium]|nr:hypothetical protein [Eubacteriales bacterium]